MLYVIILNPFKGKKVLSTGLMEDWSDVEQLIGVSRSTIEKKIEEIYQSTTCCRE